jgi:hypothetical protein
MRWFKRLFVPRAQPTGEAPLWLYVRCRRCGEAIRVRADRRYDLVSEMREPGETGPAYTLHKDIVGERCFQRIEASLALDHRLQVVERRIVGGEWLTEAEYVAASLTPGPNEPGRTE